ncbi:DeoR family transcriptional regulator [Cohaesibacter celericrescens]|uniref:DeoR family transcriptional regulator n=1 Tax=Cohaesibacter celericrescens TaxID=2067669 RepID=A0A2N5XW83_9HYPH|nr:DeoR family transcriptional regulator [Cohaesibacter celericrescens]PLW78750.1 DeoR family transcriptional regulator [Cohaesibacter celericrescens]
MQTRRENRLNKLTRALEEGRSLHLKEAADLLGVSEMTVRRDVATAQARFSFLGGHIVGANDQESSRAYFLYRENSTNVEAKRKACDRAIQLIEPGDVIFLDCGTTLPYMASALTTITPLTVICYSINIAEIICKKPNLKVILLGGEYHPSSASFASDEAMEMLAKIGINKAFISAGGLHFQNGISCSNFHEVRVKQMVMSRAVTNILVMDSTKIGKVKAASFAALDQIDFLTTDDGMDDSHLALFNEAKIVVNPKQV